MSLGSGQISLGGTTQGESIAVELGLGATSAISLADTAVYQLAGFSSASNVDMGSFKNKSHSKTLSSGTNNIQNLNIYNALVAAGWDRSTTAEYTIESGVYIWSDDTSLPALTTGGAFPNGLTIYNKGYVMGKGGNGASKLTTSSYSSVATAGGPAVNITTPCSIVNTGYIGGGGGGGGAMQYTGTNTFGAGGGGAGGGKGGDWVPYNSLTTLVGGAGGGLGQAGGNGSTSYISGNYRNSGSGGGRIMPGTGGTGATNSTVATGGGAGGGGGSGSTYVNSIASQGYGGNGGSGGNAGGNGYGNTDPNNGINYCFGGGGGWAQPGGTGGYRGLAMQTQAGAAGGASILYNGYAVSVSGTGTVY